MPTYKATVRVAGVPIQIEAEGDRELFETIAHLQALDDASEGQDARFMFRVGTRRSDNKRFKYYGFIRREDGAELTLGQRNEPSNPAQVLFAYDRPNPQSGYRGSVKYRGYAVGGPRDDGFSEDDDEPSAPPPPRPSGNDRFPPEPPPQRRGR